MESASYTGQHLISESMNVVAGSVLLPTYQNGSSVALCVHFWAIESPNGPTSAGTCKLCGEVREFRNSMYSSTWSKGMVRRGDGWEAV